VVYYTLGRHKEAIEFFKRAIALNPDYAEAHYSLGMAFANSGNHKLAVESLKRAVSFQPEWADAHYNLGILYLILKDRGAALAQHRLLRGINEDRARQFLESLDAGYVVNVNPR